MNRLAALASATLQPAVEQAVRRAALKGIVGLIGMMFILLGLVTLSAAGFLALRIVFSPLEAALVAAGAFFLLGGVFFLIASARGNAAAPESPPSPSTASSSSPEPPAGGDPLMNALLQGQFQSEEFEALVRKNAKSLAFGALIAGVAFGSSPELQKALAERIRKYGK